MSVSEEIRQELRREIRKHMPDIGKVHEAELVVDLDSLISWFNRNGISVVHSLTICQLYVDTMRRLLIDAAQGQLEEERCDA